MSGAYSTQTIRVIVFEDDIFVGMIISNEQTTKEIMSNTNILMTYDVRDTQKIIWEQHFCFMAKRMKKHNAGIKYDKDGTQFLITKCITASNKEKEKYCT